MQHVNPYELVKLRMMRNAEIAKLLEIENKVLRLELIATYRKIQTNIKTAKILKEMNDIEKLQSIHYDTNRDHDIKMLTTTLNNIIPNIKEIKDEIINLQPEFEEVTRNIKEINKIMPTAIIITDGPACGVEYLRKCSS